MTMLYKIPLLLTPQPEGGFTVTSPLLPELVTEGESIDEVLLLIRVKRYIKKGENMLKID